MRLTILTRRKGERRWQAPSLTSYSDEAALQMMLRDSPELLPVGDPRRPIVMAAELGVSVGSIDLVGVSPTGWLTVVETKLRANPEIRRSVVGQLFAYASALWELPYEDFDARWRSRTDRSLAEHVAAECAVHELAFDEEAFRAALADNLASGRFTLAIAVDEITDELRRIIEYLSAHTDDDVDVIALELGYTAEGDWEIVVPQAYGIELAQRKTTSAARRDWVLDDYFAALEHDSPLTPIVRRLLTWGAERGLSVVMGHGKTPGPDWRLDALGIEYRLFGVDVWGKLWLSLGNLRERPVTGDGPVVRTLIERLNAIPGFAVRPDAQGPAFPLTALASDEAMAAFTSAFGAVIDAVRSAEAIR